MISWCTHEFTPTCTHLQETVENQEMNETESIWLLCFCIILLEYHGPILWTVTKAAPGCIKYAGRSVEWGKGSLLDMSPRPASISWPQALHRSSCEVLSRGLQGTELENQEFSELLTMVYHNSTCPCTGINPWLSAAKKSLPLYDGLPIATTGQRHWCQIPTSNRKQ